MLALWASLFIGATAQAHETSKSYLSLTLNSSSFTGKWDIPLRDLQSVVPFGLDKNGVAPVDQFQTRFHDLTDYAFSHLQIELDGQGDRASIGRCQTRSGRAFRRRVSAKSILSSNIFPPPQSISRHLPTLFQKPIHSIAGCFASKPEAKKCKSPPFSPDRSLQQFELATPSQGRQFIGFLREGVWHIWSGYDHILFLLALLLPSVLQREGSQWRGVSAFRRALYNVLKIVTAFTEAHSLTLCLATVGFVVLPSRLTESAIALSVALLRPSTVMASCP